MILFLPTYLNCSISQIYLQIKYLFMRNLQKNKLKSSKEQEKNIGMQFVVSTLKNLQSVPVFKYDDNSEYIGDIYNGMRHGTGTYKFANGESFTGKWDSNRMLEGTLVMHNQYVYQGTFQNNKLNGKGKLFKLQDGDSINKKAQKKITIYQGDWKKGQKEGYGVYYYPGGYVYQGFWVKDCKQGKGLLKNSQNGYIYEGNWIKDKKWGFGKLSYAKQSCEGQWQQDNFIKGRIIYYNGDTYEGEAKDWKREGKGNYAYCQGGLFNGSWLGNNKCGQGTMKFANGDQYQGDFMRNVIEGRGEYKWSSGQKAINMQSIKNQPISGTFYQKGPNANPQSFSR